MKQKSPQSELAHLDKQIKEINERIDKLRKNKTQIGKINETLQVK